MKERKGEEHIPFTINTTALAASKKPKFDPGFNWDLRKANSTLKKMRPTKQLVPTEAFLSHVRL